jgi:DNA-3-methyladenine glycosylase I
MQAYHDQEWGVPVHEDRTLFEFITLEGAQAGLSWNTILRRRDGYRAAFRDFDVAAVGAFDDAEVERILREGNIIRNRQKVVSTVANARAIVAVQREFGTFAEYVWSFVPNGRPIRRDYKQLPATTAESDALSKALKKRGFGFVGPTICYAFMQACGLVDDHARGCFKYVR